MNDTGRGAVEIKSCGQNLCGNVVWVKDQADADGCGKQIMGDVKPVGSGMWDNGWIYSPERKKKFDVELKPLDDGTLRVKGYAGMKFLSKTMIWKRAPADLALCSGGGTVAAAQPAPAAKSASTALNAPATKTANLEPAGTKTDVPVAAAPAKAEAAAPAPAAKSEPATEKTAEADTADDSGSEGGMNLSDLKLDEFIKKTGSGNCQVDLPWVKLNFKCNKNK
jgi:hypothetical protein